MKSLIFLWKCLAEESAKWCCTSTTRDLEYVTGRFEHEGLSFFTITLADFGKDFQKSLDLGSVSRDMYQGFSWHAGLPRFLGGFLDLVFDRTSGTMLDDPCVDAIKAIRQLTLMFAKINLPCSSARESAAMSGFISCEQDMKVYDSDFDTFDTSEIENLSFLLFGRMFKRLDSKVKALDHIPRHGPGATAERLTANGKFNLSEWHKRLEDGFPHNFFLFPRPALFLGTSPVHVLEPGAERPVRVISVPKTMKTPRIIAIEPTCMQYTQQALLEILLRSLEGDDILSSLLGFDDQVPNQDMASAGSSDGSLATLDLSEASDRVSNQLVRKIFSSSIEFSSAVQACRSRRADVPGHGVIRLSKFASMGSALCFPIEAMTFLVLVLLGIQRDIGPMTRDEIKSYRGRVRIYGDDIIVPVEHVHSVVSVLELFGAQVNRSKSFWNGKFRESCGKEYFDGNDVSIVKVRRVFPERQTDAPEVISLVSLRNQLYEHGYWDTCKWLDGKIKGVIRHFPIVEPSSPVLGRHSVLSYNPERISDTTHAPLVKGYVVVSRPPRDNLDGDGALLKFFLKRGKQPFVDVKHLERTGRPHAVNIKLRWATPF